ncbi:MAG: hypothetical protein QXE16_04160 [Candidatus Bathyarchaeia archaeon]
MDEPNLLAELAEQLEVETVYPKKPGSANLSEEHHSFYKISHPH